MKRKKIMREKKKNKTLVKQFLTLFNISYIALYHLNIAMVRGIPDIDILNYLKFLKEVNNS